MGVAGVLPRTCIVLLTFRGPCTNSKQNLQAQSNHLDLVLGPMRTERFSIPPGSRLQPWIFHKS